MDFYERVKQLVKTETSLSLKSFIESLSINYETYNGQKRHDNMPRADEAVKIANALNTTVEYLVTGKDSDTYRQKYEKLVSDIKNLLP